jgi:hypothetical protein
MLTKLFFGQFRNNYLRLPSNVYTPPSLGTSVLKHDFSILLASNLRKTVVLYIVIEYSKYYFNRIRFKYENYAIFLSAYRNTELRIITCTFPVVIF